MVIVAVDGAAEGERVSSAALLAAVSVVEQTPCPGANGEVTPKA